MKKVIIAIGCNHNHLTQMRHAQRLLASTLEGVRTSEMLWTEPIGRLFAGKKFTNMLVSCHTHMTLGELCALLKDLERQCGNTKDLRQQGIVMMDMDVLLYDTTVCHPDDWQRDYVRRLMPELE